jgi:hypothetical protein
LVTKDVEYDTEGEIAILELFIVGAAYAVEAPEAVPLMLLAVRVKVQGPDPVTLILPPLVMAVGPVGAPVLDEV